MYFPKKSFIVISAVVWISLMPSWASAHCDSMDGPVIRDSRLALEKGDPAPVLKWVSKENEESIRRAFKQTMSVRSLNKDAQELADRNFFETVVRIHRAGEGEPFTGLKPAGAVDPGIEMADKALEAGSAKDLANKVAAEIKEGVLKRANLVIERKKHMGESIDAGREYVAAYVDFIHFVENLNRLSSHESHGHKEPNHKPAHHDEE